MECYPGIETTSTFAASGGSLLGGIAGVTAEHIVGYDIVDHLTEKQLVAHGRTFFAERTRLGQSPAP